MEEWPFGDKSGGFVGHSGRAIDSQCLKPKNDVQPIRPHIVLVTVIDKLRKCLPKSIVFFLITHYEIIED